MQQVTVTIDAEGNVKVEAGCGIKGKACHDVTRAIEQAIGRTTGDQLKPEFHQQQEARLGNATAGPR